MMLSRLVCASLLVLVLCIGSVASVHIIFDDYTSGVTFTLNPGLSNHGLSDVARSTDHPGTVDFALIWNGDAVDDFALAYPETHLTVTSRNNVAVCSLAKAGVTLSSVNPHCNYSVSWTEPFFGVLSITYNTGNTRTTPSAQMISMPFTHS